MGQPAARMGDAHTCNISVPPGPHGTNTIAAGCPTVMAGGMAVARLGDPCACGAVISAGSFTVLVGGQPAARMGDPTNHPGVITMGLPTVLIG